MTEEKQIPEPETTLTIAVARLDENDIYQGIEQIQADQMTSDHVLLTDGCDLPAGKYFWDRSKKTFMPLLDSLDPQQRHVIAPPVAQNALAWCLLSMHSSGFVLPDSSARWLDEYVGSVDFFGSASCDAEMKILTSYIASRKEN